MGKRMLDKYALPTIIKESIIEEIMQGELKPGDKLIEAKYSEMFGTSRAPVREALYLLNLEGFVVKTPRKGAVVKGFTKEEMTDILQIRNFLEILAIDRMSLEDRGNCLEAMNKLILKMDQPKIDRTEYAKLNYEFHYQLILACKSEVIEHAYSRLATPLISLQTMSFIKEAAIQKSLQDHKEIKRLIEIGNIEEAKAMLHAHNHDVLPRVSSSLR